MTLHFAGVPFEFVGFSNDELDILRPELKSLGLMTDLGTGTLPALQVSQAGMLIRCMICVSSFAIQIDGLTLPETLPACRYVAQTRGLYPNCQDARAVLQIESILTLAQHLFDTLIIYHYRKYNTKGGAKQPADNQDREVYGRIVAAAVENLFLWIDQQLDSKDEDLKDLYLGTDWRQTHTIADLFVCYYRWLLGLPEFR